MTGGLQEQVTDGENWFGVGVEPCSKAVIGSQNVPYIYEDRISEEDIVNAMLKMYKMSKKERNKLGKLGQKHVKENYSFKTFSKKWPELLLDIHERHGSWENRKNHKSWHLLEVK